VNSVLFEMGKVGSVPYRMMNVDSESLRNETSNEFCEVYGVEKRLGDLEFDERS
jgi:hypothetical protein